MRIFPLISPGFERRSPFRLVLDLVSIQSADLNSELQENPRAQISKLLSALHIVPIVDFYPIALPFAVRQKSPSH